MTKEELLLKNICARIPYGVKFSLRGSKNIRTVTGIKESVDLNGEWKFMICSKTLEPCTIENCYIYLRPMSSMTTAEAKEYISIPGWELLSHAAVEWLNARHFDYDGLIPKGLAKEASVTLYGNTNLMLETVKKNNHLTISMISAIDENNGLGKAGKLLYSIKEDLAHFKKVTNGHTVIMGSNTWDSLPKKPLAGRRNIVVSSQKEEIEGAEVFHNWIDALDSCHDEEVMIIGGARVYREIMPVADHLYITEIFDSREADTWFPEIDLKEWKENLDKREFHSANISEGDHADFMFKEYERI